MARYGFGESKILSELTGVASHRRCTSHPLLSTVTVSAIVQLHELVAGLFVFLLYTEDILVGD